MAPAYLPRVGAFPIVGEKSIITLLGTGLTVPASVQDDCPLIGKMAPEINLPDHLGRRCSLQATIALGRPIILFFFPLAGSPHCTKESCLFRDALGLTPIFADLQAIVIGISQDPPNRSKRFVDEHHLGYRILHDESREAMNTYGVPRTMLGLIDQRCTFIIDPSGIIRAMVQGVLDADGHVAFAEKWLIRLEHELSQRSKQISNYQIDLKQSLMTDPNISESGGWTKVTYGEEDSANIGGIDAAPRHGAASTVHRNASGHVPNYSRRIVNAPYLTSPKNTAPKVSMGEAATHDPFVVPISASVKSSTKDKNIWKHWRSVFKELSSADDKPPPMVLSRNWSTTEMNGKPKSINSTGKNFNGSTNGLPRSRSSSRLKDLARNSLRRGSVTASASVSSRDVNASKDTFGNNVFTDPSNDIPAVPPLFASLEAAQQDTPQSVQSARMPRTSMIDSESSDRDASSGGTESSLSSHVSTTATSLMGTSSHGSLRYNGGNNPIPLANGVKQYQLAKPAVTSEVLMPGEVLDLHLGLPTVIKPANAQILQVQANETSANVRKSPVPSNPTNPARISINRKPVPTQHEIIEDPVKHSPVPSNKTESSQRSSFAPARPVRRSSRAIGISRPSTSSSSLTAPTEPPQDVPQDEGVQDDEEFVRLGNDGRIQVLDRPSPLMAEMAVGGKNLQAVEQIEDEKSEPKAIGMSPSQSSSHARENSTGSKEDLSNHSTPRMRFADEDLGKDGLESGSPQLAQQRQPSLREIRAQRHRSASITDGIYRIHTPTLADAVAKEVNHDQDQDIRSSLSPRPRSIRMGEPGYSPYGTNGVASSAMTTTITPSNGRDSTRLRRPMAAPKDITPAITKQLSKSSILDSPSSSHQNQFDNNTLSVSPSSTISDYPQASPTGTIQKVVRKANLRTDQPIIIDSSRITAASIGDVPPRPAPPIPIAAPNRAGTMNYYSASPMSVQSETLPASDFAPSSSEDARRPSVSSMGTFGRRGSDIVE